MNYTTSKSRVNKKSYTVVMEKDRHIHVTPVAWVAVVLLIVALVGMFIFFPSTRNEPATPEGIGCTLEAKICPDGSAVGRVGKDCHFDDCPDEPPVKHD